VRNLLARGADCCSADGRGQRPVELLGEDKSEAATSIRTLLEPPPR
jgi:hypothetical protein